MTSASAEEMIGHDKAKNNLEIRTSLVDVKDGWRWLEIQVLQNGLDLAADGRSELQ